MLGLHRHPKQSNKQAGGYAGALAGWSDQHLLAGDRRENFSAWAGAGELDQGELEQLGGNGGKLPIVAYLAGHVGMAMSECSAKGEADQGLGRRGRKLGRLKPGRGGRARGAASPLRPGRARPMLPHAIFSIWNGLAAPLDLSAVSRHGEGKKSRPPLPQTGHGVRRRSAAAVAGRDARRRHEWDRARVRGDGWFGSVGVEPVTMGGGVSHVN